MEAEALGRQMVAYHGHVEVGAVPAPELGRQWVAEVAGAVGPAAHLTEQLLPLLAGDTSVLEVGARPLAPVVEELNVLRLQRLDLALDEVVELA